MQRMSGTIKTHSLSTTSKRNRGVLQSYSGSHLRFSRLELFSDHRNELDSSAVVQFWVCFCTIYCSCSIASTETWSSLRFNKEWLSITADETCFYYDRYTYVNIPTRTGFDNEPPMVCCRVQPELKRPIRETNFNHSVKVLRCGCKFAPVFRSVARSVRRVLWRDHILQLHTGFRRCGVSSSLGCRYIEVIVKSALCGWTLCYQPAIEEFKKIVFGDWKFGKINNILESD